MDVLNVSHIEHWTCRAWSLGDLVSLTLLYTTSSPVCRWRGDAEWTGRFLKYFVMWRHMEISPVETLFVFLLVWQHSHALLSGQYLQDRLRRISPPVHYIYTDKEVYNVFKRLRFFYWSDIWWLFLLLLFMAELLSLSVVVWWYFLIVDFIVAYRSLGQEVFCSVREADYEIASYARQHSSMGILGQDSDFIIYDRFVKIIMLLYVWSLLEFKNT